MDENRDSPRKVKGQKFTNINVGLIATGFTGLNIILESTLHFTSIQWHKINNRADMSPAADSA